MNFTDVPLPEVQRDYSEGEKDIFCGNNVDWVTTDSVEQSEMARGSSEHVEAFTSSTSKLWLALLQGEGKIIITYSNNDDTNNNYKL